LKIREKKDTNYPFIDDLDENETVLEFLKKFSHIQKGADEIGTESDENADENSENNVVEIDDNDPSFTHGAENDENNVNEIDFTHGANENIDENVIDDIDDIDENNVESNEMIEPEKKPKKPKNEMIEPDELENPANELKDEPKDKSKDGSFEKPKVAANFSKVDDLIKRFKAENI
jgi:hypothetical protein